jgi:hypothetical protein
MFSQVDFRGSVCEPRRRGAKNLTGFARSPTTSPCIAHHVAATRAISSTAAASGAGDGFPSVVLIAGSGGGAFRISR